MLLKSRQRIVALLLAVLSGMALSQGKAQGKSDAAPASKAAMETFQIPSHGQLLNALLYVAAGSSPHPTVVLLHGFPGNERNLDLAQAMRRAGWNVLYFNYRGSWGTPGDFSFSHCLEDVASAVAYLKTPENAAKLRIDPSRIVLIGHSMGGFMAILSAATDPSILAMGTISAAPMADHVPPHLPEAAKPQAISQIAKSLANEGMAPLAGCTPESLAQELVDHLNDWQWSDKAAALESRPVLMISSDDGLAAADDAFASKEKAIGNRHVTTLHLATDHAYSDKRLELSAAVLQWLGTVTPAK